MDLKCSKCFYSFDFIALVRCPLPLLASAKTIWNGITGLTLETFRSDYDYDYDYEIRTWKVGTRLLHVAVASASNETLDCQFATTGNEMVFPG